MNRVTIKHFDVVRTANMVAVLYAVIVLVMLVVFIVPVALLGGIAGMSMSDSRVGAGVLGLGLLGGLLFAVVGMVFYGVMGWVMTAILCALYNVVAGRIGGIRLQVDVEGPYPGGPGYGAPVFPSGYRAAQAAPPAVAPAPGTLPPPPGWGQPGS